MKKETMKLHYSSNIHSSLDLDIDKYEFKSVFDMQNKISELLGSHTGSIWLFTWDYHHVDQPIVNTRRPDYINEYIQTMWIDKLTIQSTKDGDFFLYEFSSWEECYGLCLMLREGSSLCHNKS